jgi:hypothetical protein
MAGVEILAVGDEAQADYEAKHSEVQNTDTSGLDTTNTDVVDESQKPVGEVTGDKPSDNEEANEEAESTDEHQFYWGDTPVDIEVPQEISAALAEHKIDADKLIGELFSKDGKFELSAETRKPLDKAFGKHIVDGYLGLYKQQNQMFLEQHKQQQEATRQAIETNIKDFDTLVGGDDGWNELNSWASENLNEQELANLNAVMALPVEHYNAQRTVLEALQIKRQAAASAAEGDTEVNLISDSGAAAKGASDAVPNTLSKEKFQELMWTDRYRDDAKYAQSVDEARRRGQAAEKSARR